MLRRAPCGAGPVTRVPGVGGRSRSDRRQP